MWTQDSRRPSRFLAPGFVAIGANDWFPIEFRDFSVEKAGSWEPPSPCSASRGPLTVRPCSRNGLIAEAGGCAGCHFAWEDQAWELLPSYQLRHISSGRQVVKGLAPARTLCQCHSCGPCGPGHLPLVRWGRVVTELVLDLQALSPTLSSDATRKEQLFVNDYTLIRNSLQAMTAQAVPLGCSTSGSGLGGRGRNPWRVT